jgi:uncharacterized protein YhbP (UPF0306 family)
MNTGDPDERVPAQVLDYLREHNTLTLATASPAGIPRASTYLYVSDGPTLYFWVKTNSNTARHIEQNSVVSFTIDEYASDLRQTRGVQGMAECSPLLSGEEVARVADLFGQKFPSLAPGNTLSISFFRIAPTELQFIDNTEAGASGQPGVFGAEFHQKRAYSVFSELPVKPTETIFQTLNVLQAPAGSVIARQGGPADKFFIVVEGEAEVVREEDGDTTAITSLGPGSLFGEAAILGDRPRATTVRAVQPTTLLAMDRDTFRDVVAQSLGTTKQFDEVIRARLQAAGSER